MATFARIEDGIVREVVKVSDNDSPDEESGSAFLVDRLGGQWVQTFYDTGDVQGQHPRGKYAAIGDAWDGQAFAPPVIEPIAPTV